ncbi:MAG: phage tail tube protein, partial [Nocardioidaceae bacterium]
THTFTPGDLNGKSLTVQFGRPDEGGTVRPMTYLGTKITAAQLAATVNDYVQLTLSLYAQQEDNAQALAVASYPAGLSPFTFVHGALTVAAAAFDVEDVTLSIDNGLATDRHRLRTNAERPKEPLMADLLSVTGTATVDFTDLTAYNRYVNGTEAAMVLDFNAGASARLTITMNVRFDGDTPNVEGAELLTMDMPFKAVSGTSDAAMITAVLINGDSAP